MAELYYFVAWPFILFGRVVEFIVWEFFSDGRWTQRKVQSNPTTIWMGSAIEANRQIRELEQKLRRQEEELKERKK